MIINKSKSASYPNQFQRSATVVKKPEVPSSLVPQGKITITENEQDIDVAKYALADVDVEMPEGKITITENGQDIDIAEYALADVAVEGSGGDSDFSTAQVTVTFAIPNTVLYIPTIVDTDEQSFSHCLIRENGTYPVILYKGTSIGVASSVDDSIQVSIEVISGDAEASDEEVIITGDCTITIVSA